MCQLTSYNSKIGKTKHCSYWDSIRHLLIIRLPPLQRADFG